MGADYTRGSSPRSLRAGPLTFVYLRDWADAPFDLRLSNGRLGIAKTPVVVRAGARVTLVVAASDVAKARLMYDSAKFADDYELDDGDTAITFEACADEPTPFNGGFLVAAPGCVSLEVWPEGAARPIPVTASFSRGSC